MTRTGCFSGNTACCVNVHTYPAVEKVYESFIGGKRRQIPILKNQLAKAARLPGIAEIAVIGEDYNKRTAGVLHMQRHDPVQE